MTVIQPIFYGGSGGDSNIKLKALTASASSLILAKNQSADLSITPTVDLSNAELYEVSCDDSRVRLEKQPNHCLRVITPDEKFSETTKTVIHFRATDDSGVNLDVPLTLQAGLSEEEKKVWASQHSGEHKIPTAGFEPVPGWKPFENYGSTPAEIIANCVRNKDYYALFVGDYFDETVNGATYRWTIAEFNHYGRGEALLVPDKLMPSTTQFASSDNTYRGSYLESTFNSFYKAMPSSLKPYVLNMSLPWMDPNGSTSYLNEYVFPPSEIEAFGSADYSKESSSSYKKWACFTDNASRARNNQWYWLRSTSSGSSTYVPVVDSDGSHNYDSYHYSCGACPCFCIG